MFKKIPYTVVHSHGLKLFEIRFKNTEEAKIIAWQEKFFTKIKYAAKNCFQCILHMLSKLCS